MTRILPHFLSLLLFAFLSGACGDNGDEPQAYLDCPDASFGTAPMCSCQEGYLGEIAWDEVAESYTGECLRPLDMAVRTGDVSHLSEIETALTEGLVELAQAKAGSEEILRGIYGSGAIEYNPNPWSQFILTGNLTSNFALVPGSVHGRPLATAGRNGDSRYAAFGSNPFSIMDSNSAGYATAMKRLLIWLVTGDAAATSPAQVTLALGMLGTDENAVAY